MAAPLPDADVSDRELLNRYLRRKDESAFASLVRRHERTVLAACRHVLADPADVADAFQATFLVLLRNARRVTWHSSLGGWLFAVAHRIAVSARRKAELRTAKEGRAASRAVATAGPPDLSWREACDVLHEELDRLRDTYRLPLLLCYLDGLPRDEAAKRLGLTTDAVRGRLDRGREKLRTRLARRGVTLSAGLLAALAGAAGAAGRRTDLIAPTVAAAAGGPGPRVAVLVHGVNPMSLASKAGIALTVTLVVLIPLGADSASARSALVSSRTVGRQNRRRSQRRATRPRSAFACCPRMASRSTVRSSSSSARRAGLRSWVSRGTTDGSRLARREIRAAIWSPAPMASVSTSSTSESSMGRPKWSCELSPISRSAAA